MIRIERLPADILHENNSGNHQPEDQEKDLSYEEEIKKTRLCNYKDFIEYPSVWTFEWTGEECKVFLDLIPLCLKTSSARLVKDEVEPLLKRLTEKWVSGEWFFRLDMSSPKDGVGHFPMTSPLQVLTMLLTSQRALDAFRYGDCRLYFVPFDTTWDISRECRVFIYQRGITAISQYDSYKSGFMSSMTDNQVGAIVKQIKSFLTPRIQVICDAVHTDNIVCDIYIDSDNQVKIIECNSFGYWLRSGSCLFHWIKDKNLLYANGDIIVIRIVNQI